MSLSPAHWFPQAGGKGPVCQEVESSLTEQPLADEVT